MKNEKTAIVVDEAVGPANEEDYFFEGTEKLLELWFASSYGDDNADLRSIERSEWEALLKNVNCEIISQKSNESITAYVLSESSLFVSKNRFILKTCGKTTLLAAVHQVLKLVHDRCGFDVIIDCFYSHKNFMRPELQPLTYRSFDDEVATLDNIFEGGAAYALGRINQDCWYLFTIDAVGVNMPDQTLEVIMTEVDNSVMAMFTRDYGLTAKELTEKSGISSLIPGAVIDEFLFDPCGYSMNGILPNVSAHCPYDFKNQLRHPHCTPSGNAPFFPSCKYELRLENIDDAQIPDKFN